MIAVQSTFEELNRSCAVDGRPVSSARGVPRSTPALRAHFFASHHKLLLVGSICAGLRPIPSVDIDRLSSSLRCCSQPYEASD